MARKSSKKNKFLSPSAAPAATKKEVETTIEKAPVDAPAIDTQKKEEPKAEIVQVTTEKKDLSVETPAAEKAPEAVTEDSKEEVKEEFKKEANIEKPSVKEEATIKEDSVKKSVPKKASKKTASEPVKEKRGVGRPKKEVATTLEKKTKKTELKHAKAETKTVSDTFVLQSSGKDYSFSEIVDICKNAYRNGTKKNIKHIDVYVKAENGGLRAYYVVNGKPDGSFVDL